MKLKRITHLTPPAPAGIDDPDLIVSTTGFCWRKLGSNTLARGSCKIRAGN